MDITVHDVEIDYEILMHQYTTSKNNIKIRIYDKYKIIFTVSIFVTITCWCLLPIVFDFVTEHFVNVTFRKSFFFK